MSDLVPTSSLPLQSSFLFIHSWRVLIFLQNFAETSETSQGSQWLQLFSAFNGNLKVSNYSFTSKYHFSLTQNKISAFSLTLKNFFPDHFLKNWNPGTIAVTKETISEYFSNYFSSCIQIYAPFPRQKCLNFYFSAKSLNKLFCQALTLYPAMLKIIVLTTSKQTLALIQMLLTSFYLNISKRVSPKQPTTIKTIKIS